MPARNRIKDYVEDSYYHIYNRGVEKRDIFLNEQDYAVYLSFLKTYLEPKNVEEFHQILANEHTSSREKDRALKLLHLNNFSHTIDLISFCLMPNHFHLLVYQKGPMDIDEFMNSLSTRYTMYFNRKYKRVGALCQGVYKAARIETEEQLLYLTKYIHRNPDEVLASQGQALRSWSYSSYPAYLGLRQVSWLKSNRILSQFSRLGKTSYEMFVEDISDREKSAKILVAAKIEE